MTNIWRLSSLIVLLNCFGCDSSGTVTPTGLTKPPPQAAAEKFSVKDVVITLRLPKDNPKKSLLSATDPMANASLVRNLPPVDYDISCLIESDSTIFIDRFSFGLSIDAPLGKQPRIVHGSGAGEFRLVTDGRHELEGQLTQLMPFEVTDKAVFNLRVIGRTKNANRPIEVDVGQGKVIIKQEE